MFIIVDKHGNAFGFGEDVAEATRKVLDEMRALAEEEGEEFTAPELFGIQTCNPRRLYVLLHIREREGGVSERHPTLEAAAASMRAQVLG